MRALIATAATAAALLATAAPANARGCRSDRYAYPLVIYRLHDIHNCGGDYQPLEDLVEGHPRAIFRKGLHRYTLPRHGTNYRPGQNYHCSLRVWTTWDTADEHPVAHARGTCVYMHRSGSRFYFRSNGPYA